MSNWTFCHTSHTESCSLFDSKLCNLTLWWQFMSCKLFVNLYVNFAYEGLHVSWRDRSCYKALLFIFYKLYVPYPLISGKAVEWPSILSVGFFMRVHFFLAQWLEERLTDHGDVLKRQILLPLFMSDERLVFHQAIKSKILHHVKTCQELKMCQISFLCL